MFSFSFLFLLSQDTIVILILLMEGSLQTRLGYLWFKSTTLHLLVEKFKTFLLGGSFFFFFIPLQK